MHTCASMCAFWLCALGVWVWPGEFCAEGWWGGCVRAYVANYLGVRQITHVITCKTCFVNYLRNYAVKLRRNFPSYALANYLRNYVQNVPKSRNLRKLRGIFFKYI